MLSWVLAGIGQVDSLRDTLVFKGGTALKKCYFGNYRFSEDLDFSGLEGVPTGEAMEGAVREASAPHRSCWTSTPPWRSPASATRRRSRIREARRRSWFASSSPGNGSQ